MTGSIDQPFRSFRFRLELGSIEIAGFSECTGLETEVEVEQIFEGGRNGAQLVFPKASKMSRLTLKRGLTDSHELWDWHQGVITGEFGNSNSRPGDDVDRDIATNCSIVLLDETGEEARRWQIFRPLPVKWTGPDLKADGSAVAFESIVLAHEGLRATK